MIISRNRNLYLLSFIEGGAVMATELIGAKILAPYFGTSLYVWTSVMALTLGGLACGYFVGGRLSQRENHEKILMQTVLAAAAYMCCLPFISSFFLYLAVNVSLIPATIFSSSVVLFPPVFMMGMVSPLLIKSLTSSKEDSGKKAGEVYAISTVGGILFCFLTGFYLIPQWGINYPLFFISLLLAFFPVYYFVRSKLFIPVIIYFLCAASLLYSASKKTNSVYVSEGLLGRLEVRDAIYQYSPDKKPDSCRLLLVNNIIQSVINLKSGESELEYTSLFNKNLELIGNKPHNALLLGLGGGAQANELCRQKVKITAVELDERIVDISKKYFMLDPSVKIINDDARHALYSLEEKFDLVLMDIFNAEVTPAQALSLQSFEKIKSLLNENGLIVINTYGYLKDKAAGGNLILLNTLQKAGFSTKICYIGEKRREDYRNFEIFASAKPITQDLVAALNETIPDLSSVAVNTDQRPVLEYANADAAKKRRISYLNSFIANR
ncbi:MAG: fused MFS/spermidine synthase [Bacteroidia bacterium]